MSLPERIGRYRVVRLLGQGGMGRVLLARDSVLERLVAVKILRDDLGLTSEQRAALFDRMRQEAKAAAKLSHPHLVVLHDMGEEPEVGLFLVFEYVQGPSLRDRIAAGPLSPEELAPIARHVGDALTQAHASGVVHRDVKPENILLSAAGAKLADFGIARLPDSTLTAFGTILGTPAYSAPEALAAADYGPLSDQFSFAATLYECASGRRAFPGDDTIAVATRVATETPEPLRIPGEAWLANRLDAVLARGMAKDPARRFPSCFELGQAVAATVERPYGTPTTIPPLDGRASRLSVALLPASTRRAHNLAVAAAILVLVVLVLVGGRARKADNGVSLKAVASEFQSAVARSVTTKPRRVTPSKAVERSADAGGGSGAVRDDEPEEDAVENAGATEAGSVRATPGDAAVH